MSGADKDEGTLLEASSFILPTLCETKHGPFHVQFIALLMAAENLIQAIQAVSTLTFYVAELSQLGKLRHRKKTSLD